SLAKWLSVPRGRTPRGMSRPTTADAAQLIVPSPPPATRTSQPPSTARRVAARFGEDLFQLFGGLGGASLPGRAVEYHRDVSLAHAGCRRRRWVTSRS